MSKYTTELRYICEEITDSPYETPPLEVIKKACPLLFNFDYPIFDPDYKSVLEQKILSHFYTQEIAAETFGLWKFWLQTKMNEIMPYYNKLYEVATAEFNPLYDVDLKTERYIQTDGMKNENGKSDEKETGKNDESRSSENNTTNSNTATIKNTTTTNNNDDNWNTFQDTPQGGLNGIRAENYLTDARHIHDDFDGTVNDNGTNTSNGETKGTGSESVNATHVVDRNKNNAVDTKFNDTTHYVESVTGKRGGMTYAQMIAEYAESLINVDMMIITELQELFMGVW